MKNVFIDPSKNGVAIRITPQSLHVIGFQIQVIDGDENTVLANYTGQTSSGAVTIKLDNPPLYYKGKFISGTFTFLSPTGEDYSYKAKFSILTDDIEINPTLLVTGKTNSGQATTMSTFKAV